MSVQIAFATPPFGLEPLVDFSLRAIEGASGLFALTAGADDAPRLYVLDAAVHLPDYSPEITEEQGAVIGLRDAADALVLVVANPAEGGTTVNLLAPIVVDVRSGAAAQFILDGQDHPLRAVLAAS